MKYADAVIAVALGALIHAALPAVADDRIALAAFRAALDSDRGSLVSWNVSVQSDPCQWAHVTCFDGRVRGLQLGGLGLSGPLQNAHSLAYLQLSHLDLSGNEMRGVIPPFLAYLTNLTTLSLSSNPLYGSAIPPQLGALLQLTTLSFAECLLAGPIPAELGALQQLVKLDLSSNNFAGPLPPSFGQLSALQSLDLHNNSLSGPLLPPLCLCSSLAFLDLSLNAFTGPLLNCSWPRLTSLDLSSNLLSASIPSALLQSPALASLTLRSNQLEGPLPSALHSLANLSSLDLSANAFSGGIPVEFGVLSALLLLSLASNNLSGAIPPHLGNLSSLTALDLSYNRLSAAIPVELGNATALSAIDLTSNDLCGDLLHFPFSNLPQLTQLSLGNNRLSGPIPAHLPLCCSSAPASLDLDLSNNTFEGSLPPQLFSQPLFLSTLFLAGNRLSGDLPLTLSLSSALIHLDLQGCGLSGPVPPLPLAPLERLSLQQNFFSGPIPLLNASFLTSLSLAANALTGPLPHHWAAFPFLTALDLSGNRLSGPLPPPLLSSSALRYVDLSANCLSGPLPLTQTPSNLSTLLLANNRFSGPLPTTLAWYTNLASLQRLSLAHNLFNSTIPPHLATLSRLTALNLSANSLSGPIPPQFTNLTLLSELDLSSNSLSGPLPPPLSALSSLLLLDLSHNALNASLPPSLGNLTHLTHLDISANSLSGLLPPQLAGLLHLTLFNCSFNPLLRGALPGGNLTRFPPSSYTADTALCGLPLPACPPPPFHLAPWQLTCMLVGSLLGMATVATAAVWGERRRALLGPNGGEVVMYCPFQTPLSYRILQRATHGFSAERVVGQGGFGAVYRAVLSDGSVLAVKRLHPNSGQGVRELRAEVQSLSRVRHRHLVKLLASYCSDTEALLIYEYAEGGDLETLLFPPTPNKRFREWRERLRLLLGTARGLQYLHAQAPVIVIHRDIKPANILVGRDGEAQIADFGLAREVGVGSSTCIYTGLAGTVGYLPPEYVLNRRLSRKSDVYAFGVVLLQTLTGRRPSDPTVGGAGLPAWVSWLWTHKGGRRAIDPGLGMEEGEVGQVVAALKIGLMCTARRRGDRPTMGQVVHLLENVDCFQLGDYVETQE